MSMNNINNFSFSKFKAMAKKAKFEKTDEKKDATSLQKSDSNNTQVKSDAKKYSLDSKMPSMKEMFGIEIKGDNSGDIIGKSLEFSENLLNDLISGRAVLNGDNEIEILNRLETDSSSADDNVEQMKKEYNELNERQTAQDSKSNMPDTVAAMRMRMIQLRREAMQQRIEEQQQLRQQQIQLRQKMAQARMEQLQMQMDMKPLNLEELKMKENSSISYESLKNDGYTISTNKYHNDEKQIEDETSTK